MNLWGFSLIQRALMAAPNTLKDFKVLTKVSLNWKIHVEKSPKKGATWKQANKVAMHMTDTGVPNPKNPQYTIKEWDKTRPLTALLAELGKA
jgi:hypothetical protein